MSTPEALARQQIDLQLAQSGWVVQDHLTLNLCAGRGVAVREFPLPGHGFADYLLFVDREAVGVVEAKKVGTTLTGVELQSERYGVGLPATVPAAVRPLPFLYESTGVETRFTNRLDPEPRSRRRASSRAATSRSWTSRSCSTSGWSTTGDWTSRRGGGCRSSRSTSWHRRSSERQ